MSVTITTHPNIALIKYWGKRNEQLFLPTKSSLSVGLEALTTTTTIDISSTETDEITINGQRPSQAHTQPILDFLKITGINNRPPLAITTTNSFPTAAGLASSASGFAALALGLNHFFSLNLSPHELSALARRGSGSACRSLFGGFVVWHRGHRPDGSDSFAEQLLPASHWPTFRIIVAIVAQEPKKISSRTAMQNSVTTSPIYEKWVEASESRLDRMHRAILDKNFELVGQLAEQDCIGMHKTMHTSQPPVNFLLPATANIMQQVTDLRTKLGIPCYFTIDAGPNVKILCQEHDDAIIMEHLRKMPQIIQCIVSSIAGHPYIT